MNPVHILLVEDNEGDILLIREVFENANMLNQISVVRDGKEATDFISKLGEYRTASSPNLILLDINLPRKNGHEVLQFIKTNEQFKHIPVVILTTSSFDEDILKAYKNHVNCYISKPIEADAFSEVILKIENFWSSVVKLPVQKT